MSETRKAIDRVESYNKQLKALNAQIEKLQKGSKEYEAALKRQKKLYEEGKQAVEAMRVSTNRLSTNLKSHRNLISQSSKAAEGFASNTQKASKAVKGQAGGILSAAKTLLRFGAAYKLINAATVIFNALTTDSIKESIEFEKSLGNLAAVAGVSSDNIKKFGDNALAVAGKTKFTANEIVGLQTELSKLGFTSEDVIKSTQQIAFSAQALGSPLNETAALVGKLRNQFGLLVEQTAEIGDTLVTTINNSALSFETFGTAIQYVGPIANTLGLTLQQTTGAMAALADAGFTASRIGTGLRGIFTELGKTSADVERSLKGLAEQNISLGEAVDLVGKRNAAQLLTLLKNIDAIEEGNKKYYEQGRALIAASEQANTLSGQMQILNSEFKKFQIGIGDSIVKSDLFIVALGLISTEAQRTAYGFKILSEIGLEKYTSDVEKALDVSNDYDVVLRRLLYSGQITSTEYQKLSKNLSGYVERTGADLEQITTMVGEQGSAVFGEARDKFVAYARLLSQGIEEQQKQISITRGQEFAAKAYGDAVQDLIDKSLEGNVVNKEADTLNQNIQKTIDGLTESIKNSAGFSDNYRLRLEAQIQTLKKYQDQLTNTYSTDAELLQKRTSEQSKALKIDLRNIKERNQKEIDAINERAKVETEIAETAEQRAEIEAERAKLVSEQYKKQAAEIRDLSKEYDTQTESIERSAAASDKLSKVLGSDVIKDLNKAFSDYSKEISELQKALDSGAATQEVYDAGIAELRTRLETTIGTFRTLFGTSPELEQFFSNLLLNFDAASQKAKKVDEEMEKTFGQALKTELLNSLGDALDTAAESISKFNDVALENTKNRLDSEKSAIKNRYETENDILKSQLDNQLITESQFRAKQKELQKAKVAEENDINRQIFEAEKKRDRQNATSDYAQAIASIIPTLIAYDKTADPVSVLAKAAITGALATASYGAELAAIGQKKFFPTKFAEGGMVNGPSHDQGGVPFSVQGQGGYEMEGGEYIVNKRATSMHRDLLERINKSGRLNPTVGRMKFAEGGLVSSPLNESVDYLKAIAEATTSTAIGVSKPVRAYVADKDLRGNATERRIRDRNDRI